MPAPRGKDQGNPATERDADLFVGRFRTHEDMAAAWAMALQFGLPEDFLIQLSNVLAGLGITFYFDDSGSVIDEGSDEADSSSTPQERMLEAVQRMHEEHNRRATTAHGETAKPVVPRSEPHHIDVGLLRARQALIDELNSRWRNLDAAAQTRSLSLQSKIDTALASTDVGTLASTSVDKLISIPRTERGGLRLDFAGSVIDKDAMQIKADPRVYLASVARSTFFRRASGDVIEEDYLDWCTQLLEACTLVWAGLINLFTDDGVYKLRDHAGLRLVDETDVLFALAYCDFESFFSRRGNRISKDMVWDVYNLNYKERYEDVYKRLYPKNPDKTVIFTNDQVRNMLNRYRGARWDQ